MGKCSFCGSDGTSASSCPLNPNALSRNWEKHPLASGIQTSSYEQAVRDQDIDAIKTLVQDKVQYHYTIMDDIVKTGNMEFIIESLKIFGTYNIDELCSRVPNEELKKLGYCNPNIEMVDLRHARLNKGCVKKLKELAKNIIDGRGKWNETWHSHISPEIFDQPTVDIINKHGLACVSIFEKGEIHDYAQREFNMDYGKDAHSPLWYSYQHYCHSLVVLEFYIATCLFPDETWHIIVTEQHSFVANMSDPSMISKYIHSTPYDKLPGKLKIIDILVYDYVRSSWLYKSSITNIIKDEDMDDYLVYILYQMHNIGNLDEESVRKTFKFYDLNDIRDGFLGIHGLQMALEQGHITGNEKADDVW